MKPIDLKLKFAQRYSGFISKIPLTPNQVTTLAWVFAVLSVYFIYKGFLVLASIFVFLMWLCDVVDGAIARVKNQASLFGNFYDWFTDKCVEAIVLFSLRFVDPSGLPEIASVLSLVLGCIGAKAESLRVDHDIGAWSKLTRAPVLVLLLVSGYVHEGLLLYSGILLGSIVVRLIDVEAELRCRQ